MLRNTSFFTRSAYDYVRLLVKKFVLLAFSYANGYEIRRNALNIIRGMYDYVHSLIIFSPYLYFITPTAIKCYAILHFSLAVCTTMYACS